MEPITGPQYRWLLRLLKGVAVAKGYRTPDPLIFEHFKAERLEDISRDDAAKWIVELCNERRALQ